MKERRRVIRSEKVREALRQRCRSTGRFSPVVTPHRSRACAPCRTIGNARQVRDHRMACLLATPGCRTEALDGTEISSRTAPNQHRDYCVVLRSYAETRYLRDHLSLSWCVRSTEPIGGAVERAEISRGGCAIARDRASWIRRNVPCAGNRRDRCSSGVSNRSMSAWSVNSEPRDARRNRGMSRLA